MRFNLVDRIVELEPGRKIRAVKNLTSGEEYLADHFPSFPVMPGVLQLQALVEAGAWLLRETDDFRHSVIVLREVKNIKYGSFVQPGNRLEVTVELAERDGPLAVIKGRGEVEGTQTVSAKLILACSSLAECNPALKAVDEKIVQHLRELYRVLRSGIQQNKD